MKNKFKLAAAASLLLASVNLYAESYTQSGNTIYGSDGTS